MIACAALPHRRMSDMAKRTQNIIVTLLVLVLFAGIAWPMFKEVRFMHQVREDKTILVAKPSRYTAADYQVRDPLNYVSPGGIFYGKDLSGRFDSRIAHIMAHTAPDASKPKHSVFTSRKREDILRLLDEAWKRRGPPNREKGRDSGRDVYDIPMGRAIGTAGERTVRLVMENNQPAIITAYPLLGSHE